MQIPLVELLGSNFKINPELQVLHFAPSAGSAEAQFVGKLQETGLVAEFRP